MKYQLLVVFFIIIISFKCCYGLSTNSTDDLDKAMDTLKDSISDVWKDVKKMSLIQNEKDTLTETGRGKKLTKMAIPLMFGFKMAGVVIAALTALKFLLLQSLVLSKFALAGAVVLGLKVLFEHMHSHLYKVTDISHISSPYAYPSHLGLESAQYEAVADPGNLGYAYYAPTSESNAADDLQGHYFSGVLQTAQAKNSSGSATDRLYQATSSKRPNNKIVRLKTIIRKTTNMN